MRFIRSLRWHTQAPRGRDRAQGSGHRLIHCAPVEIPDRAVKITKKNEEEKEEEENKYMHLMLPAHIS